MCGIGGWVAFGKERPGAEAIHTMLSSLETRGGDATGIAYAPDWGCRSTGYCKHHLPATQFVKNPDVKRYLEHAGESRLVIMHTRAETKGTHKDNKNNHPVMRKEGKYLVVHNGTLDNDDAIFDEWKIERQATVDTEALAALLDRGDSPQASLEQLEFARGSYAIAAMCQKTPDHLILLRRTSPLCYTFDKERDLLLFASTPAALSKLLQIEETKARGFTTKRAFLVRDFPDDSAMIIDSSGLCFEHKHAIAQNAPLGGWGKYPLARRWAGQTGQAGISNNKKYFPFIIKGQGGLITPTFVDKTAKMKSFQVFPIDNDAAKEVSVQCPSCWQWVKAAEFRGHWSCPLCKEKLIPPTIFRTVTEAEVHIGKARSC